MKIQKIYLFKFLLVNLIIAVAIMSSPILNGCSGCSPSGIREKYKGNNISDEINKPLAKRNRNVNNHSEKESVAVIEAGGKLQNKENNIKEDSIPTNEGITVLTWNLENFGQSKSEEVISFIANTVRNFDIVAVQEVVAAHGGAQAVARLNNELNRKGSKWDYRISDPTSGENSYKRERYAFLWKTSRVDLIGQPWLEIQFTTEIDREPFFATFKFRDKEFTLVNFHAITKNMQPETEIKYFKFLPSEYPDKNLIFNGDFNCPESHTVFNPLKKMGYKPVFKGQKTTLKIESMNNEYLSSEFDNIFYNSQRINFINSGVIKFYESFDNLSEARTVSDHIPIWFQFSLN